MILFTAILIFAYLIGSVNTSIIYSIGNFNKDIRNHGSGNAGATNMLRSFGKLSAAVTFLGDMLKAVIAIGLAWLIYRHSVNLQSIKAIVGLACVLGHSFPIFFRFKGGKGIATGSGCILMLDWRVFVVGIVLFALLVAVTRYVSVGSVTCALLYPIGMLVCGKQIGCVVFAALTAALVIGRHSRNIKALLNKTERKIGTPKE